jgi:electron transport complex protein RnfC
LHSFSHGIHPDDCKSLTADKPIRRFPFAPYYVVHLAQNIGAPARCVVIEGQNVQRGQLIAKPDGFVSVPVHAPVSGKVRAITNSLDFNGVPTPSVIIEPNPASGQEVALIHETNPDAMSPDQIVQAIQDMGMVGLGGAAFPTHVKLKPPKGKSIETIILNGAECEPYLTSDYRVMVEQSDNIIAGAKLLLRAVAARELIIAIEDNKPEAIATMSKACAGQSDIRVEVFKTKYPQGAEKMLVSALLKKEVPSGGLPADIGVMISNIATAAEIGNLLPLGMGLIERVVTVSGSGISNPGNYLIPIGTPLDFILKTLGTTGPAYKVIFGGPMMGKAVSFLKSPVTKGTSGILVMASEIALPEKSWPCINCGACVQACPMQLIPSQLGRHARAGEYQQMAQNFNLMDCFECGCCSYVCPSNIPLVQQFRLSKKVLRERIPREVPSV